jgi:retron-type reverse transcriptase
VTLTEVLNAWKSVQKAGGSCGYDRQTIQDMEVALDNQLYKIWNRMASGSYMARPVLLVNIPKWHRQVKHTHQVKQYISYSSILNANLG